jgi:hypothetical protein
MTHQEKLEAIRQKCIEANPEIAWSKPGCRMVLRGDAWWEHAIQVEDRLLFNETTRKLEKLGIGRNWKIIGRPIRLADVLLVLMKLLRDGQSASKVKDDLYRLAHLWNCFEDDLTKQSPETIDFLFTLLQPEGTTRDTVIA